MSWTLILIIFSIMVLVPLIVTGTSAFIGTQAKKQLTYKWGEKGQLYVGGLGTILHESGHAIAVKLFHQKLTGLRLLQFRHWNDINTLGYVNHFCDNRSFYQKLGNFFIGIAPFFSCSGFLYALHYFLIGTKHSFYVPGANANNINTVGYVLNNSLWNIMNNLKDDGTHPLMTLIFAVVVFTVSLTGFSISEDDWRGSLDGLKEYLIVTAVLSIVVPIVSYFLPLITIDVWKFTSLMIFLMINSWLYMGFGIIIIISIRHIIDRYL